MPIDPIGPIADSAAQFHEMFLSFISAGFTEDQAFTMLITIIQVQVK